MVVNAGKPLVLLRIEADKLSDVRPVCKIV
jgi:hypothetical protein